MKVIIAPCEIRNIIDANDMAIYMEDGVRNIIKNAQIYKYPLLDGDSPIEQTRALGGKIYEKETLDPLGRKINSKYAVLNDKVIIDLKESSGLRHLSIEERNPLLTSTFGTGLLILDALNKGYRDFYIYTRGSATNDAGIGILKSLGFKFLDSNKNEVELNAKGLYMIRDFDVSMKDKRLDESSFTVVTDYTEEYSGLHGIAYTYGPLKGATPLMIESLDRGLRNFALIVEKKMGINIEKVSGTGAGGGVAAGLYSFLNADIIPTTDAFYEISKLKNNLFDADLVLTGSTEVIKGEKLNNLMMDIVDKAHKNHVPVVGIFGYIENDIDKLYANGFTGIYSLYKNRLHMNNSFMEPQETLLKTVESIIRLMNDEQYEG
jgi:glycerate kinase